MNEGGQGVSALGNKMKAKTSDDERNVDEYRNEAMPQNRKGPSFDLTKDISQLKKEFDSMFYEPPLRAFHAICGCDASVTIALLKSLLEECQESLTRYAAEKADATVDTREEDWEIRASLRGVNAVEYTISLDDQQLGLTIENILERTVVRQVQGESDAYRKGVRANSCIVAVGHTTRDILCQQTHMETLETLKRSVRPVSITFRPLDVENVAMRRLEMQAFIQKRQSNEKLEDTFAWVEKRIIWIFHMIAVCWSLKSSGNRGRSTSSPSIALGPSPNISPVCTPDRPSRVRSKSAQGESIAPTETVSGGAFKTSVCEAFTNERCMELLEHLDETKKIFVQNIRVEAMPYFRMTKIFDALGEFYRLMQQSSVSSKIIYIIETELREVCFALLQLEPCKIPGCEDTSNGNVIPSDAPFNLLSMLVANSSDAKLRFQAIPMFWRLASSSSVSCRMACSGLVPAIYDRLPKPQQLQMRGLMNRLMVDKEPFVRSHLVSSICVYISQMIKNMSWLLYCVTLTTSDPVVAVRSKAFELGVLCLESPWVVGQLLGDRDETEVHLVVCRLLPLFTKLAESDDAGIRCLVASKCDVLCYLTGFRWSAVILDMVLCMLRDESIAVRCTAIKAMPRVVSNMTNALIKQGNQSDEISTLLHRIRDSILPPILHLKLDAVEDVRISLAIALPGLVNSILKIEIRDLDCEDPEEDEDLMRPSISHVRKSSYGDNHMSMNPSSNPLSTAESSSKSKQIGLSKIIIRAILQLLNDSASYLVRYTVLQQLLLPELCAVSKLIFTPTYVTRLLVAISPLSLNKHWRYRVASCGSLALLVAACVTVETRSQAASMVIPLLSDPVFEVRRTAATIMCVASLCDCGDNEGVADRSSSVDDEEEGLQQVFMEQDMGRMWLDAVVLPHLEQLCTSVRYHDRIMALHMVYTLVREQVVLAEDVRFPMTIDMALALLTDKISNVRLALAKLLLELMPLLPLSNFEDKLSCWKASEHSRSNDDKLSKSAQSVTGRAFSIDCNRNQKAWFGDVLKAITVLKLDEDKDVLEMALRAEKSC